MTINGLKNTIRYDEDVFRWSLALLQDGYVCNSLPRIKIQIFRAAHFAVIALNFILCWFIFKVAMQASRPLDFAVILPPILGVYLLEIPYKNFTAALVTGFIDGHFSAAELEDKTLLQLSVAMEKKYATTAIVDTLSAWMRFFRIGLLIIYITVSQVALMLCLAWILRVMSRSTLFARFLRTIVHRPYK